MLKRVVLVGDSIRFYYAPTVIEQLEGMAEVISPERIGGDSRNILANLTDEVIAARPHIIHLNCGLHDIKREFATVDRTQVPLGEYAENLRAIFTHLREETDAVLFWATTTPVIYERHHTVKGFDRLMEDVAAYNAAARQVIDAFDVAVNDLFAFVMEHGCDEILRPDGVHFTDEGSRTLGVRVADVLRPYLP